MTPRPPNGRPLTAVDIQILLTLASGPLHGYGIKLDVAERTDGEMKLGSGTLYEAIQRLEHRTFIYPAAPPIDEEADPRRRYYQLGARGESALREELERLRAVVQYGQSLEIVS